MGSNDDILGRVAQKASDGSRLGIVRHVHCPDGGDFYLLVEDHAGRLASYHYSHVQLLK